MMTTRRRIGPALLGALACLLLLGAAGCGASPLPGTATTSSPAYDYYPFTEEGFVLRWQPGSTIRVYLPNCMAPFIQGCLVSYSNDFLVGINEWQDAHALLGIQITICTIVPAAAPCDADEVRVIWDDGTGSSGYPVEPGQLGFAAVLQPPASPSRIIVMTTRCNVCPGLPSLPDADVQAVAAHEWGHMLGIWNHSFDPADLMYPYKLGQPGPSNRDLFTLVKAYTSPPSLDLTALPPQTWSTGGGLGGAQYLIRFVHTYHGTPATSLEFNPPGG